LIIGKKRSLQSERKLMSEKLKEVSIEPDYKLYESLTHKFWGVAEIVLKAREVPALTAQRIKTAWGM
jgi:acetyl esterase